MKRIVMHWTAGAHKASAVDLEHYHLVIEGDGRVVYGKKPISANKAPLGGNYAAHTRGLNTDSIGIAVCAMAGAEQVPFRAGRYPITSAQVETLVREVARLAEGYGIPVTRQTILSHAEVQPTLGVTQAGKWDIAWLPGRSSATDPIGAGDYLRGRVADALRGHGRPAPKPGPVMPKPVTAAEGKPAVSAEVIVPIAAGLLAVIAYLIFK